MNKDPIHVEGLGRLARQCKTLDKTLYVEVKQIGKDAAMLVAKSANTYVPVGQTGKLARSIRAHAGTTSSSVTAGGASVPYAAPIHWGWPSHNIKPVPFLYKALDARRGEVIFLYHERVHALVEHSFPNGGPD